MPRIALNPLTMEEMQFAKMSNMQMDKVEGMELLMGEDGTFEEFGANQIEDSTSSCSHCANCGNEFDMAIRDGVMTMNSSLMFPLLRVKIYLEM